LSVLHTHPAPVVLAKTLARAAEKLDNLPERCQLFRPFTIAGTPEQVIQVYQSLADAGISYFIAQILGNDAETLDVLAERVRPTIEKHTAITP
jgi:hypothetical protein